MVISRVWSMLAIGASVTFWGLAAQAQAPGLYYAWRSINGDLTACLNRSTAALTSQELGNIQVEGNSVAGTTADSTAVFVCLESLDTSTITTTVMIMVSSNDDDIAFELRETLKESF